MADVPILLFRSASPHYPLDILPELKKADLPAYSLSSLEEYIAAPARRQPFIAILEVGSLPDLDRALLAYDWSEKMQPFAPARYILLVSSRNISLGDKAKRFSGAELLVLPQPARSLLFKIDLQRKLLSREKNDRPPVEGFSSQFEEGPDGKKRVLVLRGQGPKAGEWQSASGIDVPQGKVRWRWVSLPAVPGGEEAAGFRWEAESAESPRYEAIKDGWVLEGEGDNLLCFRGEKEVFSAQPPEQRLKAGVGEDAKSLSPADAKAAGESGSTPRKVASEAVQEFSPEEAKKKKTAFQIENIASDVREKTQGGSAAKATGTSEESRRIADAAEAEPAETRLSKSREGAAAGEAGKKQSFAQGAQAPASAEQKTSPLELSARFHADGPVAEKSQVFKTGEKQEQENSASPLTSSPQERRKAGGKKEKAGEDEIPSVKNVDAIEESSGRSEAVSSWRNTTVVEESVERTQAQPKGSEAPADKRTEKKTEYWDLSREQAGAPARASVIQAESAVAQDLKLKTSAPDAASPEPMAAKKTKILSAREEVPVARPQSNSGGAASPGNQTSPEPSAEIPAHRKKKAEPLGSESSAGQKNDPQFFSGGGGGNSRKVVVSGGESPAETAEESPALQSGEQRKKTEPAEAQRSSGGPARDDVVQRVKGQLAATGLEEDGRQYLVSRYFVTRTLGELSDKESSWHPVGQYRVYLAAQARYFGIKHPRDLLPLWVYEGELAPEFLDESKAWKFYDRPPVAMANLESLPKEVEEFLYRLAGLEPPAGPQKKGTDSAEIRGTTLLPEEAVDFVHGYGVSPEEAMRRRQKKPEANASFWGWLQKLFRGH
jgi:hypothetical protein